VVPQFKISRRSSGLILRFEVPHAEYIAMTNVVVLSEDQITEDQRSAIIAPLDEFSAARGFEFRPNPIYLLLYEGARIVGGIIGHSNWEWLHIEILSVATHLRSRGYGRQLMEKAEEIARTRGCFGIWVDTYTFQSPGFYERLGYRVFGTLPNYPRAEQRIFFMKML
jgi:GNAT superfamily N-acetyltransferase